MTDEIKVQKAPIPKTIRINLEDNDDIPPTGLMVGLNGTQYLIKPGFDVDVPLGVKEILDHAVVSVPNIDPQTRQVIGYRDRLKYPYRTIS